MAFLRRGLHIETLFIFKPNPSPTSLHDFTKGDVVKAPSLLTTKSFWWEGSMTVEAAVLLPIIISLFLFMGDMIEVIRVQGTVQMYLWNIGTRMCVYGYLTDEFLEVQNEEIDLIPAVGIHGDMVELTVAYPESLGGGVLPCTSFLVRQRFLGHMWTGYDISGDSAEVIVVYVAEHGTVYHMRRDCGYVDVRAIRIEPGQLEQTTNRDGVAYAACAKCRKDNLPSYFYITEWGECYHWQEDCPSLKRWVFSAYLEEVSSLAPCSKCAEGGQE